MSKFDDFYNYAKGKVWDTNGNQSSSTVVQWYNPLAGQCVSLIKAYLKYLGYGVKAYGNAIDYWRNRNSNGILSICNVVSTPQNGDIVVSAGGDPTYGHIFIYYNGQAFTQNCCNNPRATVYPLSYQGAIYGYLRPKCLVASYNANQLISERGLATFTVDSLIVRKDTPTGADTGRRFNAGNKQEYTAKWVGNGHRYISWVEGSTRYFVAVSNSETQGVQPWATFSAVEEKPVTVSPSQLTQEDGVATLTTEIGVNARKGSPTGAVVRTYQPGAVIRYYWKYVGNGHRYIVWKEGNDYIFLAISGSETQGKDVWATFTAPEEEPEEKPSEGSGDAEGYKEADLIQENGVAHFTRDGIRIRKGNPVNGSIAGEVNSGDTKQYTEKWIGNGHRYISYKENNVRYFIAVSGSEKQGEDPWATFTAPEENKPVEDKPSEPEDKPQEPAKEFPDSVKMKGLDISEHNNVSDDELKKYDFIILRSNWWTTTDKRFEDYASRLEKLGIPYGVYCYDYAGDGDSALEQAKYTYELIKDKDIKMGVWMDMEDADGWKAKNNYLNKEHCALMCKVFCDFFKEKGYFTGIYSTKLWFENYIGELGYPKWIANWGTNDGTCQSDFSDIGVMHQYTSTPLDKDVAYKDVDYFKSNPIKEEDPPVEEPDEPSQPEEPEDKPNTPTEGEKPSQDPTEGETKPSEDDKPSDDGEKVNVGLLNRVLDALLNLINKILSIFK